MSSPHSSSNSSSAFDLLAEPVRRWIWDQGWTEMRDIQERAITTLLSEVRVQLRGYVTGAEGDGESSRSVAMVELLGDRWCEPPAPQALHLSTLTHQVLSVIAQHGGAIAQRLYGTLCRQGPFREVSTEQFACLLRRMGSDEMALIEQPPDGNLLLGSLGEKLVEHYSFYAVFQTSEDYRVLLGSKRIGVLPMTRVFVPDMTIILSGRRWRIIEVHSREKVIEVTQDRTGTPPPFDGGGGLVHDGVVRKMKVVLSGKGMPAYLDKTAAELLEDARSEFHRMGLDHRSICESGENVRLVTTWAGTIKTSTLSLKLRSMGFKAVDHEGFLDVEEPSSGQTLVAALEAMAEQTLDDVAGESLSGLENMMSEKFHRYLSPDLLPCVAQNLLRRWCVRVGRYSIRFGARLSTLSLNYTLIHTIKRFK